MDAPAGSIGSASAPPVVSAPASSAAPDPSAADQPGAQVHSSHAGKSEVAPRASGGKLSQPLASYLADLDPDNDTLVAPPEPLADCYSRLTQQDVQFELFELPLSQKRGTTFTCGAEQTVVYKLGPEKLRFNARPRVTCRVALALAHFERIAQEQATKHLGSPIKKVVQLGTYNCRKMARFTNMVSEHSYANAIDIQAFELRDGRKVNVLNHFGSIEQGPTTPQSEFLRSLAKRLYHEQVFSVVLTPFFDHFHRDHLHLDQARYRLDGTGPE
jgi:hypothetical protein